MARAEGRYSSISSEGGLLPPDLLDRIAAGDSALNGLRPQDFGLDTSARINEETARIWDELQPAWSAFRAAGDEPNVSETRTRWLLPLFEALGYGRLAYRQAAEVVDGHRYLISHRAGDEPNAPPIHTEAAGVPLDRAEATDDGVRVRRMSAHSRMQEYLNRTEHLWGIVSNGKRLRLLRDNQRLSRAAYLEFDLEAMMEGSLYSDFVLLYLVLHRTRLPMPEQQPEDCLPEQWVAEAEERGARALDHLRDGVETAIRALGQGLLEHPANQQLRDRLTDAGRPDHLSVQEYYRQLLRLVYRFLFLLAAEDRELLFSPDDPVANRDRFLDHYGAGRLRELVFRRRRADRYDDLWRSLLIAFHALREEEVAKRMGIRPLGGLFAADSCPALDGTDPQPMIRNDRLLEAIRGLTYTERDGRMSAVNYRDMDVEELGSVYESLLELQPVLTVTGARPTFELGHSGERKSSGSYYTNPGLVEELIRSALDPVIEQTVAHSGTPEEQRAALLALNVCDPACGSGHFLLAAARRIGRAVARIDSGDAEPDPTATRHGIRQAIAHCVYGVDLNPLAVDLCKVALWLEAHEPGKPTGFLDHHIRQGNALVGATRALMDGGIPTGAFKDVTGDNKTFASGIRKQNAKELKGQLPLGMQVTVLESAGQLRAFFARMERDDDSLEEVAAKERDFLKHQRSPAQWRKRLEADLWTAAYFWPLQPGEPTPPTQAYWKRLCADPDLVDYIGGKRVAELRAKPESKTVRLARKLARDNHFFHWELEFEDVFSGDDPGFDVILGNPPWERVKLQEQEFFASRDARIASAPNAAARKRLIDALKTSPEPGDRALYHAYLDALRGAENESKFLRTSTRFPLTGRGDVNTYSVFSELMATTIRAQGRSGIIVPTGIATDDTNKHFFGWLVDEGRIASIYDFENREKLFATVDSRMKFSLLTMSGKPGIRRPFSAAFFLTQPWQLRDPSRVFTLSAEEIELLNPNTRTCPIFRTVRDAEITKAIYRAAPVLVREGPPEVNPWGITFKTMFHMSNDSHLFRTRDELTGTGYTLDPDGRFRRGPATWLPLYEAKLIHQYDHRFATFEGSAKDDRARPVTLAEHQDPDFVVTPRYWVDEREVERKLDNGVPSREWLISWRDFARNTDARTFICNVFPRSGAGDNLLIMQPQIDSHSDIHLVPCLLGCLNSLVFDFAVRQKVGGVHLKFYTVKQLPVLPPHAYTSTFLGEIIPRVIELVFTSKDIAPFANDVACERSLYAWDVLRRARLSADLDGIYAHLYGLDRDDFSYVLDQFPIVQRNDEKEYGEFRTKRLCLEAYDRWQGIGQAQTRADLISAGSLIVSE